MDSDHLYLGGQWRPASGTRTIDVVCPSDERTLGSVADAGPEDVDAAVGAARSVVDGGEWPRMPMAERAAAVGRLASELRSRQEQLVDTLSDEVGTPHAQTFAAHVADALEALDYYADLGAAFTVEQVREGTRGSVVVRHEPVGVVAAVVPWNVPLYIAMIKVAPALVAGCAVVLKLPPETPLHGRILAEAASAALLPAGVLSILTAGVDGSECLVRHPGVDKVAFTGSTETGRHIAAICGRDLKRVTLELGGKSAAVVLRDADLAQTIPWLIGLSMSLTGQFCTAQSRILVHRSMYDVVTEHLSAAVGSIKVGHSRDAVDMGPLISERQRQRVLGYIALGEQEGARITTGGAGVEEFDKGWFVRPTVFADVDNAMRIAREEIFGPVVTLIPYDTEDDAAAIANDSSYGLHGTVWTSDVDRGVAFARRIRTGTYGVNGLRLDVSAPFGGMKQSGLGRELGPEGLLSYTESKSIALPA